MVILWNNAVNFASNRSWKNQRSISRHSKWQWKVSDIRQEEIDYKSDSQLSSIYNIVEGISTNNNIKEENEILQPQQSEQCDCNNKFRNLDNRLTTK